jgi:branched-chain amino acid transport system permease protein
MLVCWRRWRCSAHQLFITRTFTGRAIMAVSQDQLALQLMAADPIRSSALLSVSIATRRSPALLIIIQPVEPSVGREYIGRVRDLRTRWLGSMPGTLIAAILLSIVENHHRHLLRSVPHRQWHSVFLLTLAFRPAGLWDGKA